MERVSPSRKLSTKLTIREEIEKSIEEDPYARKIEAVEFEPLKEQKFLGKVVGLRHLQP